MKHTPTEALLIQLKNTVQASRLEADRLRALADTEAHVAMALAKIADDLENAIKAERKE